MCVCVCVCVCVCMYNCVRARVHVFGRERCMCGVCGFGVSHHLCYNYGPRWVLTISVTVHVLHTQSCLVISNVHVQYHYREDNTDYHYFIS